jgi:hypothetical protein
MNEEIEKPKEQEANDKKFADVRSHKFIYTYLRRKNKKRKEEQI